MSGSWPGGRSQDSRATTFQHINSSLHWGISRGRNWFCAMLLNAIKPLKKKENSTSSPSSLQQESKSKLKAPIQGYDFPWSLAARCQQSMTSMWCGAEDPLRIWVYRPCQLVPRATTFQPFFCFKPRLFCTCLKGLGWFRHLLCKPANHLSRDEILVEFWLAKSDKDDWVHLVLQCVVHIYIYIYIYIYPLVI